MLVTLVTFYNANHGAIFAPFAAKRKTNKPPGKKYFYLSKSVCMKRKKKKKNWGPLVLCNAFSLRSQATLSFFPIRTSRPVMSSVCYSMSTAIVRKLQTLCHLGGFKCKCKKGYYGANFKSCKLADECELGIHKCHKWAKCLNTKKSYNCKCRLGFDGNGRSRCKRKLYSF